MNRYDLPRPFQVSAIDFNGEGALLAMGENVRPYPRYLPIPFGAVAKDHRVWTLDGYRRNLTIFPELYFVLGRDTAMDEQDIGEDTVLGFGVGLCVLDDAAEKNITGGAPRDINMCRWYSQYADDSHLLLPEIYPIKSAAGVKIRVCSPTLGDRVFDQDALKWDALPLLNALSPLNAAKKYDLVMLGASEAPFRVPMETHFAEGEEILIEAGELGGGKVIVNDLRSEDIRLPVWKPRPFVCDPAYLDLN